MPDDPIKGLYDNILATGKVTAAEIGDYPTFVNLMSDSAMANKFYNNLLKNGVATENELGDFNGFYSYVSSNLPDLSKMEAERPKRDFTPQISDLDKRIEQKDQQMIDYSRQDWQSELGDPGMGQAMEMFSKATGQPQTPKPEAPADYKPETIEDLNRNRQYLADAKDLMAIAQRRAEVGDEESMRAFGKGLTSPLAKDFFTQGISEMMRAYDVVGVARKAGRGEPLTDEEQTLLTAYGQLQQVMQDPSSISFMVGSGITEMIPYMVQFAATGGIGNAAKAGVNTLLKVTEKNLPKLIAQEGYKAGMKQIGRELPGLAVKGAAQMPLMPMTYTAIGEKLTGEVSPQGDILSQPSVPEGILKGLAVAYPEVFTESLGTHLLGGLGLYGVGKNIGSKTASKMTKWLTPVEKFRKAAQFGNFLEEYSEEMANNFLTATLDPDTKYSDVFTGENMLVTGLTISAMGGAMYSTDKAYRYFDEKALQKDLANLSDDVKADVIRAMQGKTPEEISKNLNAIYRNNQLSPDQLKSVMSYSMKRAMRDGMEGGMDEVMKLSAEEQLRYAEYQNAQAITNNFSYKDGQNLIMVSYPGMPEGQPMFVKDGDVTINQDGTVVLGNTPVVVMGLDGKKEMVHPKNISEVSAIQSQAYINQVMGEYDMRVQAQRQAESMVSQAAEQVKEATKPPTFMTGDVVTYKGRQAEVQNTRNPERGITIIYQDTDEVETIKPQEYGNLVREDVGSTTTQVGGTTAANIKEPGAVRGDSAPEAAQPAKVGLTSRAGKSNATWQFLRQQDGSYQIEKPLDTEARAKAIATSLGSRYGNLSFSVVDITDKADPFASNRFVVKATTKTTPATPDAATSDGTTTAIPTPEQIKAQTSTLTEPPANAQQAPTPGQAEVVPQAEAPTQDQQQQRISPQSQTITGKDGRQFELRDYGLEDNVHNIEVYDGNNRVGGLEILENEDGTRTVENINVEGNYRRNGIASEMLDYAEGLGYTLSPSKFITPEGKKLIESRSQQQPTEQAPETLAYEGRVTGEPVPQDPTKLDILKGSAPIEARYWRWSGGGQYKDEKVKTLGYKNTEGNVIYGEVERDGKKIIQEFGPFELFPISDEKQQEPLPQMKPEPEQETEQLEKEPWQMTKGEFNDATVTSISKDRGVIFSSIDGRKYWEGTKYEADKINYEEKYSEIHKSLIQQALSDGKPVPANVLADYPELKPEKKVPSIARYKPVSKNVNAIREDAGIDIVEKTNDSPYANLSTAVDYKPTEDDEGFQSFTDEIIAINGPINQNKPFFAGYFGDHEGSRWQRVMVSNDVQDIIEHATTWDQQEIMITSYNPQTGYKESFIAYPESDKYTNESVLRGTFPRKTQEDQVKQVLASAEGGKHIKDIADATGIVEPNIRRILGVGAKKGTFKRVAPGVYTLETPDGKNNAYIYGGDAVEVLPQLAAGGFKADMIFLDIPYETAGIRSGNRELSFKKISPEQFRKVVDAISKIARDKDTPVIYMYATSKTGEKDMQLYTDKLLLAGFKPVARGAYTKISKDGTRLTMPFRPDPLPPEAIVLFTQSGEFKPFSRELNLEFTLVRPKGYATEKPRELLKSLITQTTQEGDMILDPFAGSGVTGEQALIAGHDVTLVELSDKAVEGIKTRLEGAVKTDDNFKDQIKQAEAQVDTNPTEAQKDAGNYQKGHVTVHGMEITIENPAGSTRSGVDKTGKKWETYMPHTYGYFLNSEGKDGDHIDVFIGPNPESLKVFVIDQVDPKTGEFDESKVMLGFNNVEHAKTGYKNSYEPGWQGLDAITEVSLDEFKKWLYDGQRQRKPFNEYKDTPAPSFANGKLLNEELYPRKETIVADKVVNEKGELLTPEQANKRLEEWKAEADRVAREQDHSKDVILSIYDRTGVWAEPFARAGYQVRLIDAEHGNDIFEISPGHIIDLIEEEGLNIVGILSAPPCTSYAVSGARWWENIHDAENPDKVEEIYGRKAAQIAKTPLEAAEYLSNIVPVIIEEAKRRGHSVRFHSLENPIGRIAKHTGLPNPLLRFNPNNYGDPYTKQTNLWGDFNPNLPTANVEATEGSKIAKLRGDVPEQKAARSITPQGFAYAFFMANHDTAGQKVKPALEERSKPSPKYKTGDKIIVTTDIGDRVPAEVIGERGHDEQGEYRYEVKFANGKFANIWESNISAKPKPYTPEGHKYIGVNSEGNNVFEDANENRYKVYGTGIMIQASVGIVPDGTILIDTPENLFHKGRYDFLTTEEVELFKKRKQDYSEPKAAAQPSENRLVTEERYAELKRRMKDKLNNLTAGYDPEMFSLGAEIAMYHIEKGARKFGHFVKEMVDDFGDKIRPYLKSFYKGARNLPGMEDYANEMTPDAEVDAYDITNKDFTDSHIQVVRPASLEGEKFAGDVFSKPKTQEASRDITVEVDPEKVESIRQTLEETPGKTYAETVKEHLATKNPFTTPVKEDTNTKTGETIFLTKPVVKTDDKAEYREYQKIAKDHNGYYSSFKRSFLFKSLDDALQFRDDMEARFGGKGTPAKPVATKPEPTYTPEEEAFLKKEENIMKVVTELRKTDFNASGYAAAYNKVMKVIPALPEMKIGDYARSGEQGDAIEPLSVEAQTLYPSQRLLEDPKAYRLIMEQWYVQEGDLMSDPRIDFAVYPSLELMIPLNYEQHGIVSIAGIGDYGGYQELFADNKVTDRKGMTDVLRFVNGTWFPNLVKQGRIIESFKEEDTDEKPGRSTEALETQVEAIENQAESISTPEAAGEVIERANEIIAEIDSKLKLLGEYKPDEGAEPREYPNVSIEAPFKRDLAKFSKEIARLLKLEHDTDKKGKPVYADVSVAPVSGDGHFILWYPNSEFGVYVHVYIEPTNSEDWYDIYSLKPVFMWRITTKKDKYRGLSNRHDESNITAGELAKKIGTELISYVNTEKRARGEEPIRFAGHKLNQLPAYRGFTKQSDLYYWHNNSHGYEIAEGAEAVDLDFPGDWFIFEMDNSFSVSDGLTGLKIESFPDKEKAITKAKALLLTHGKDKLNTLLETAIAKGGYSPRYKKVSDNLQDSEKNIIFVKPINPQQNDTGRNTSGVDVTASTEPDEGTLSARPVSGRSDQQGPRGSQSGRNEQTEGDAATVGGRTDVRPTGTSRRDGEPAGQRAGEPAEGTQPDNRRNAQQDRRSGVDADANHVITPDDTLVPTGEIAKIKANIKAIKLVKKLESENRNATPEEKKALAQYIGWGGLARVFAVVNYRWQDGGTWEDKYKAYHDEIKSLLTDKQYQDAKNSTVNAHYTSREVITALWNIARRLGFKGGKALEPASGIGHIIGLMPDDVAQNTHFNAVELDEISGKIISKLYPQAKVHIKGFEETQIPENTQDLVITNVPFGGFRVYDSNNPDITKFNIHNYFIARSVKLLRPGGIGIFITSTSSLDNEGDSMKFRRWITNEGNADFIDAIRLPNTAFKENAGTEVTTDIIVIRKRNDDGISSYAKDMLSANTLRQDKDHEGKKFLVRVNEYFVANPERMLGTIKLAYQTKHGGLYNLDDITLEGDKDWKEKLNNAINDMPEDIFGDYDVSRDDQMEDDEHKEGELFFVNNKLHTKVFGIVEPVDWADGSMTGVDEKKYKVVNVVRDYLDMKDTVRRLIALEGDPNASEDIIEENRKKLNSLYDAFSKKYGQVGYNNKLRFLGKDVDFPFVQALENYDQRVVKTPKGIEKYEYRAKKSDIFSKRVIRPKVEPTTAETPQDAVTISTAYRNKLDLPYIASLLGTNEDKAREMIIAEKLAFENPATGVLEEKEEYLSGNVREKLRIAQEAAKKDQKRYSSNVEELEKVIPADIPAVQIKAVLGSTWIPPKYVKQWAEGLLGFTVNVRYDKVLDKWTVDTDYRGHGHSNNTTVYAGGGVPALSLLEDQLNTKSTIVYDHWVDNGNKRSQKNEAKTAEAQEKQRVLNLNFQEYINSLKGDEAENLERIYNDIYNSLVNRKYSPPPFKHFPGASQDITLYIHQMIAAVRALKEPVLLAHQVGTGKTYTMITIAMEWRRLGIAKKPMIVVQAATLGQFAASFKRLYPEAKLLVPSEKEMSAKERVNLFAKIAMNDYDCIIISHPMLGHIPDDPDRKIAYIRERMAELEELHGELSEDYATKNQAKDVEKQIEKLEEEVAKLTEESIKKSKRGKVKDIAKASLNVKNKLRQQFDRSTDNTFYFEELGIDGLLIDEAHAYKRLGFVTKAGMVRGIDTNGSQRSLSTLMKVRYIRENNNNKNVVFATGTPITNTMAEIWTMMKYLIPDRLEEYGISSFDQFKTTFGEVVPSIEYTAASDFKIIDRFARYINLPELITLFHSTADVVLTEDIGALKYGVGTPRLENDEFTKVLVDPSKTLTGVMKGLRRVMLWYRELKGKDKRDNRHIPLVVFGLAKAAAIDARLINSKYPDDPHSKLNAAINNLYRVWKDTTSYKGTQLVFSDMMNSRDKQFSVYDEIVRKLVDKGVPKEEIAIIHDYESDKKREILFDKVNNGEVRIVIGSTEKLGTGVNVQERLKAIHHIDAPNRPSDFEQRNGRIMRQGNLHAEWGKPVNIFTYGVVKTLDATQYQRLDIKDRFIKQTMKGDFDERHVADSTDDDAANQNFDEMMAHLSGSDAAVLYVKKQHDLKVMEMNKRSHERMQVEINEKIRSIRKSIEATKLNSRRTEYRNKFMAKHFPNGEITKLQIGSTVYDKDFAKTLDEVLFSNALSEVEGLAMSDHAKHTKDVSFILNDSIYVDVEFASIHLNQSDEKPYTTVHYTAVDKNEENDLSKSIYISGNFNSGKGVGFIASLKPWLEINEKHLQDNEIAIREYQKDISNLEDQLGKKFKDEDKIDILRDEVRQLEARMQQETAAEKVEEEQPEDEGSDLYDTITHGAAAILGGSSGKNLYEVTSEYAASKEIDPAYINDLIKIYESYRDNMDAPADKEPSKKSRYPLYMVEWERKVDETGRNTYGYYLTAKGRDFLTYMLENYTSGNMAANETDEADDDGIRFRMQEADGDIFHSNSIKALESIRQEKGTVDQWWAMLLKNGAKEAELEWMDWGAFTQGKKSLTKAEIREWMDANRIEVEEVVKGEGYNTNEPYADWSDREIREHFIEMFGDDHNLDYMDRASMIQALVESDMGMGAEPDDMTIYQKYQLPGGENYRELLLTMPLSDNPDVQAFTSRHFDEHNILVHVRFNERNEVTRTPVGKATEEEYQKARQAAENFRNRMWEKYGRGSWGYDMTPDEKAKWEKLVAEEARTGHGSGEVVGNEKVLFIEEIQSDWAQKGKKEGFKPIDNKSIAASLRKEKDGFYTKLSKSEDDQVEYGLNQFESGKIDRGQLDKILLANGYSEFDITSAVEKNKVPAMPFPKTDQWVGLAMKRMIRWAADNGFDKIAWTTGEQQAERYDLSKRVKKIEVERGSEKKSWRYRLFIDYWHGNEQTVYANSGDEIADYVGKELAEKMVAEVTEPHQSKTYSGLDMKVGGTGMKAFYDSIIPSWVNKFGKKYGVSVGQSTITAGKEYKGPTYGAGRKDTSKVTVHSFPITDRLYDDARSGFLLYRFMNNPMQSMDEQIMAGEMVFGKTYQRFNEYLGELNSMAREASKEFGVPVVVVKSTNDLPRGLREEAQRHNRMKKFTPAIYASKRLGDNVPRDTVFIIANQTTSTRDTAHSIAHEVIAHHGLRQLLGRKFNSVMDSVWWSIPDTEKVSIAAMYVGGDMWKSLSHADKVKALRTLNRSQRRLIADEYLARKAENLTKAPSFVKRAIAKIRELLRQLFPNMIRWTNNDILTILSRSMENLRKRAREESIRNARKTGFAGAMLSPEERERDMLRSLGLYVEPGAYLHFQFYEDQDPTLRNLGTLKKTGKKFWIGAIDVTDGYIEQVLTWDEAERHGMHHSFMFRESLVERIDNDEAVLFWFEKDGSITLDFKHVLDEARRNYLYERIYQQIDQEGGVRYRLTDPTFVQPSDEQEIIGEPMLKTSVEKFREFIQDKMLSVKKLQENIITNGGTVTDESDIYNTENLSTSASKAQMEAYENKYWNPLVEIISRISRDYSMSLDDIQTYMKAKHAPERNKFYNEKYKTQDVVYAGKIRGYDATEAVSDYYTEQFEKVVPSHIVDELWDRTNAATKFTLDRYLQDGFLERSVYDQLTGDKGYKYYIPLRGWKAETADQIFDYQDSDIGSGFNPFKKARGRQSESDDPLPYIWSMANTAIVAGNKNMVKQRALNLYRMNKDRKDLFYPKTVYYVDDGAGNVTEQVDNPSEALWDAGLVSMKYNRTAQPRLTAYMAQQHELVIKEGGRTYVLYFIDPNVAVAINGNNVWIPDFSRVVQETIGRTTRYLSMMLTSKNPAFIPVNWIRDMGMASMWHNIREEGDLAKFQKNVPVAFQAIRRYFNGQAETKPNQTDDLYRQWLEGGGATGYVHLRDIDQLRKRMERHWRVAMDERKKMDYVTTNRVVVQAGEWLDYLAQMSENMSRFATYLTSLELGRTHQEALADSKNVTVNFNRKGRASGLLNSLFAFFNANVQGSHTLLKLGKDYPRKTIQAAIGFMVIGYLSSMIARLLSPPDEDGVKYYDKLSPFIKQNFLVLPNPMWFFGKHQDKFVTIPLPWGFSSLFSIGVVAHDWTTQQMSVQEGIFDIVSNIYSAFSPVNFGKGVLSGEDIGSWKMARPIVPTAAMPFYDIAVNEDFAGYEIFREPFTKELENITPKSELGMPYTNKYLTVAARALNKFMGGDEYRKARWRIDPKTGKLTDQGWRSNPLLDINPSQLEHLLEGYTGGVGTELNNIVKTISSAIDVANDVPEAEIHTRNIPVLRRLYRQASRSDSGREYYELKSQVDVYEYLINKYRNEKEFDTYKNLIQYNQIQASMRIFDHSEKALKRLRERAERIGEDKTALTEIYDQMDEIRTETVTKIRELNFKDR